MREYDKAQICANGHYIATTAKGFVSDKYCSICGAAIHDKCLNCGAPFRGMETINGGRCLPMKPNAFCYNCGKPYPWTKAAIETVSELIKMEQGIDEDEKEKAISELPDVINESPRTTLAVARLQILTSKCGKFVADGIRQFAIDFGCELAKKMFGLG